MNFKIFAKFENAINGLLLKIGSILASLIEKITPPFITSIVHSMRERRNRLQLKINSFQLKSKFTNILVLFFQKIKILPGLVLVFVSTAILKIRSIEWRKYNLDFFSKQLSTFVEKQSDIIQNKLKVIDPQNLAIGMLVFTIAIIAISAIAISIKDIYQASVFTPSQSKAIPAVTRPVYYKADERQITIYNVTLPIYVESVTSPRILTMNLTLQASNRFIKIFLTEKDHIVQDTLSRSIEPIIPGFPLSEEGKEILRAKIKAEVNKLLHEQNVEGKIEQVFIDSILEA